MARPGLMLYFDILPALDKLPGSAVGELLLAALHYAQSGAEPAFEDSSLGFAWTFLQPSIDRDGATYEGKRLKGDWLTYCRQCKKDGVDALDFETWCKRVDNGTLHTVDAPLETSTAPIPTTTTTPSTTTTPNNSEGADKPPTRTRFVPPTLDEVTTYVKERGSKVDPQGFIDFYAAKGWLVGKTPMKDWKAACRNAEHWERWGKAQLTDRNRLRTDADYMGGGDFFEGDSYYFGN